MIDFEHKELTETPALLEKALEDFRAGELSAEEAEECLLEGIITSMVMNSTNDMLEEMMEILKDAPEGLRMKVTLVLISHLNRINEIEEYHNELKNKEG